MSASGDITIWVVPSRQGVSQCEHHLAYMIECQAFVGHRGAPQHRQNSPLWELANHIDTIGYSIGHYNLTRAVRPHT